MGKEFKEWLDEFIARGADPNNVTEWPEEAGGRVVVEGHLPATGEEYTIYELHQEGAETTYWVYSDEEGWVNLDDIGGGGSGDLDSRTYFLWQKGFNSASWESLPFNKRFILPATNDVDNFGYTTFSYTKGIKDTSNLQVGQTIEFYNYGKGTTPCLTTEIRLVTDTYFMVSAGGNNVYLKRATDAAWEDYAELLDLPYSTYQIFDENTAGSDYLYDLYGPIRVNVPPQISMPTTVTVTQPWAPVLNESHQITMNAGMDLRVNVCMGNDNLSLSSSEHYLDVRDIVSTPGTITKKWGPGGTDYSIDIEFSASGSGYPCTITGTVTRVGASFPSTQLCSIIVMKV